MGCILRKELVSSTPVFLPQAAKGPGRGDIGPDEDDFHTLKRRKVEVERDEKREKRVARQIERRQKMDTVTRLPPAPTFGARVVAPIPTKKAKVVVF